jgi:NAD dependent epimerase/dehydratase family enzyme
MVSASAVGFYGQTGDDVVDERSPSGQGFVAHVVREWEAAAEPARAAGIRVVHPRSHIVAARSSGLVQRLPDYALVALGQGVRADGGAFSLLLPLLRLGVGGRLGSGEQWWSLVSLYDEVRALRFLIEREDLEGAFNLTAVPARNKDVVAALGRSLHRPAVLPVPSFALKAMLGSEMSVEVLGSVRAEARRLHEAGFTFTHDTLDAVAEWASAPGD